MKNDSASATLHAAAPETQTPVVATKLRPPRLRAGLVERPALVERLRDGRERALTLVCAPAGYGKSTLLSQWVEADREHTSFVWVSLDASDSDPARLWAHVISGLHEAHAPAGERSLSALVSGPRAISETVLPHLLDELASSSGLVLILEDWHLVRSPVCDATMAELVARAPDDVRIVISSRSDPGLPIARLRAHGDIAEIRGEALRLSGDEAADLFRRAEVELERGDVDRLNVRAEGWIAGLCLALLVVREHEDRHRFVEEFSRGSRHVLDFLADDVLAGVAPEVRDFMVRSSVLDRLSGELCDAVLETSGSGALLATIARENLFLVPLGPSGGEYRYHQLFAAMLQRELRATDGAALTVLHARAATWFETHGDIDVAIEHAIGSADVDRASELVTREARTSGRLPPDPRSVPRIPGRCAG